MGLFVLLVVRPHSLRHYRHLLAGFDDSRLPVSGAACPSSSHRIDQVGKIRLRTHFSVAYNRSKTSKKKKPFKPKLNLIFWNTFHGLCVHRISLSCNASYFYISIVQPSELQSNDIELYSSTFNYFYPVQWIFEECQVQPKVALVKSKQYHICFLFSRIVLILCSAESHLIESSWKMKFFALVWADFPSTRVASKLKWRCGRSCSSSPPFPFRAAGPRIARLASPGSCKIFSDLHLGELNLSPTSHQRGTRGICSPKSNRLFSTLYFGLNKILQGNLSDWIEYEKLNTFLS